MITVNDEPVEYEPGMTVADLLRRQDVAVTMLAVWLDGELVPRDAYDTTPVRDGASLQIVPIIIGG
jgi:thiamine biosynthesis protein ThiS